MLCSRFDPQYSQPDYWLQQAQHYAEQALRTSTLQHDDAALDGTAPDAFPGQELSGTASASAADDEIPGEVVKEEVKDEKGDVKKKEEETEDGDDEDGPKVDLDTRLKMLMKGPQTSMPAFLLQVGVAWG